MPRGTLADCDNATNGIYYINGTITNAPISFGVLISFIDTVKTNYGFQIAMQTWGGVIYVRSRTEVLTSWTSWYKLSATIASWWFVLGELMNSLKLFPFMEREQILSDINKAIVPGVYGILNNRLDNLPITDWFVLIVISWRYYVVQIAYSLNYFTIYSRRSSESGETWSNWQQIATE